MDNFGLTPQGFNRPRYVDIVQAMEARAVVEFGEGVNLNERGVLGILIRIVSWFSAGLWQVAEKVYNAGFVSTADTLTDLARIGQYIGVSPEAATFATGEVTFEGDDATVIPTGTQVQTEIGLIYVTTAEVIIDEGTAVAEVSASIPGALYNVGIGQVNELTNPIAGVTSVTNEADITGGLNAETVPEFRNRYRQSVARPGRATLNAIRAALLQVEGVRTAKVIENDTDTTDGAGRPPHSIECYLLGGTDVDIANAILETKGAGIKPHGTESQVVTDDSGQSKTIRWTFATVVDIYANITLTTNTLFPANGNELVQNAIIEYIGGVDADGNTYPGLTMGDDVIYTNVIARIMSVPGVTDVVVTISDDNTSFVSTNIAIGEFSVAETEPAKLVIA